MKIEGKGGITAEVVADSISPHGIRLITLQLHYHRFIHQEFLTHRMFSRNSSSSRAIPIEKEMERVRNNPATPIYWGKNKPGMQADEELEGIDLQQCINEWFSAAENATYSAEWFRDYNLHKQIANRGLETYQFIDTVVTATEWDNFFELRLDKGAQPEIQELAKCMKEAIDNSNPRSLVKRQWHLPYIQWGLDSDNYNHELIKCSIARCARVSYRNHDNSEPNIEKDIQLYDKLLESKHLSPFEHVATPMEDPIWYSSSDISGTFALKGSTHGDKDGYLWSGNFRGWIQYRQCLN